MFIPDSKVSLRTSPSYLIRPHYCSRSCARLRRMRFVLEGVSGHGVRLGRLLLPGSAGVETPVSLLYTRVGVVPHLTNDILRGVAGRPPAVVVPLPTVYETPGAGVLEQYQQGIHSFFNLQDHFLYLSVQDPHAPPPNGYNQEKSTSVWTNRGRHKVTVKDHLRLVEAFRPSAFECLCDSVSSTGNKLKRMRKSVDRTLKFLDETLTARASSEVLQRCGLLGAIEGSEVIEERKRSASETAKRPVDGFVLEGFDLQPSCESQREMIRTITQLLPEEKLRVIHGLCKPAEIFDAVECGVDVFDGCYPYTATEKGCALTFPNQLAARDSEELASSDGEAAHAKQAELLPLEIDLKKEEFASDFSPVLEGCLCHTCLHHSRAYLHHLLATKEILAFVLLMTHNLTHYLQFFDSLRLSVQNSTYSQFKEFCLSRTHSDTTNS